MLAAAGCSALPDIEEAGLPDERAEIHAMEIAAESGADTRTCLGEDGTSILWSGTESVSLYDGHEVRKFTADVSEKSSCALFQGEAADASCYLALYPYDPEAGMSLSGSEATFRTSIPTRQTAVEGGFDPSAHAAFAVTGTDGVLHFHNAVAFIRFTVPSGNWTTATFRGRAGEVLAGTGTITVGVGTGSDGWDGETASFVPDRPDYGFEGCSVTLSGLEGGKTYMAAAAPCSLQSGISIVLEDAAGNQRVARSLKPASLKPGHVLNLGTLPLEERVEAKFVSKKEVASLSSAVTDFGIDSSYSFLINLYAAMYLKDTSSPLVVATFRYTSLDPYGVPDTFSGVIYILESTWNSGGSLSRIVLANHGTITLNTEAPTTALDVDGVLAWGPTAVIIPDGYGFGSTDNSGFQAYLHRESTSRAQLDAVAAARKILNDRNITTSGCKYYNVGYSQGGHTTISNLRYMAEHPGMYDFDFTATFAGAGPYDMPATYRWLMGGSGSNCMFSIPLTVISMNQYENLGFDYEDVFKGSLLANYRSWILDKTKTTSQLNALLGSDPSAVVSDGMVAMTGDQAGKLLSALERNSLCSGWKPATGGSITLFHSTEDDIVPSVNTDNLKAWLESQGVSVTVKEGSYGSHVEAAMSYAMSLLPAVCK